MVLKGIGVLIIILLVGFIATRAILKFVPREFEKTEGFHACVQVITTACYKNIPFLCETFPTPCDIPDNWK